MRKRDWGVNGRQLLPSLPLLCHSRSDSIPDRFYGLLSLSAVLNGEDGCGDLWISFVDRLKSARNKMNGCRNTSPSGLFSLFFWVFSREGSPCIDTRRCRSGGRVSTGDTMGQGGRNTGSSMAALSRLTDSLAFLFE
jgi:hypothetical protein